MSNNEKDNWPPSYEESLKSSNTGRSQITRTYSPSRGQQILDQLTLVRAQHLRSVINEHLIPLVEQQAMYGIAQTTIAMIPSDVALPAEEEEKSEFSFDAGNAKKVEVIGFSSDEKPQIIRLEGQMNQTEFWRPQIIVQELERLLKESLNASPYVKPPSPKYPPAQEPPLQRPRRRDFFGRMADVINQPEERSPSGNPEVGVRQPDNAGQVLVKVRLEEICLRTVNEFGIYDTMSKQCLIIRVDARC
ncbi:uncharacterized protein BDR25DRAFT_4745 [Lindgomyces ingoldianus]|uniref:Uncharacterized protein n=1 Tax=Lindgomyces ingoldianus TaxID=673940 RepID=A0ACB6RGH1_9PLEO|nr:uncharacterized protein BDR25DRAFT_4745 [Lindgomyces ingoldianus]KAF2477863.1 hypothetical protein BDR25DRAFT_4745 [Lindgomyces ingoldianus]